jgi:DNA-binding CsgD family transcriptional regulator
MNYDLFDFITRLEGMQSVERAWAEVMPFFQGHGIEQIAYSFTNPGTLPRDDSSDYTFIHTLPEWWMDRYWVEGLIHHDPCIDAAILSTRPVSIGIDYAKTWPQKLTADNLSFLDDAVDIGMRTGIAMSLRPSRSNGFGGMALITLMRRHEFEKLISASELQLYVASYYSDAHIQRLIAKKDCKFEALTPREQDCLRWLALGHRRERIAGKMKVTEVTVDFHMANIRRKLNARTREQAIAIAIKHRLIHI